jgi:hypothetical protein
MAETTFDQIWGKLIDITNAIGNLKVEIGTCASNIKAQSEIVAILAGHQKEANGRTGDILDRLVALELANAVDCGELRGARRQWAIIAGVIVVAAAAAGSAGTFIGLVIH